MTNKQIHSIALICDDFPSEGRPVYTFVKQLVDEMVRQGMVVHVIAPQSITKNILRRFPFRKKKSYFHLSDNLGYWVYRPYYFSIGNHLPKLNLTRLAVLGVLRKLEVDCIYCHFWHTSAPVATYCLKKQIPLFVACGESTFGLQGVVGRMKETITKAASGVICVSTDNLNRSLQYGLTTTEKSIVLPNCTDIKLFNPQGHSKLRNEFGVTNADFLLVFVGSFTGRKGYNRVCEALNNLQNPNIKVMFIGNIVPGGPTVLPSCAGMVFCGSVEHDDLPLYLRAADAFVLPTLNEGCCNAIVEALACGLPIVSSNREFNDDILNDNNSLRIDPSSVDELSQAIAKLYEDRDLYRTMRKYAIEHADEHSIVNRTQKIISFMNSRM